MAAYLQKVKETGEGAPASMGPVISAVQPSAAAPATEAGVGAKVSRSSTLAAAMEKAVVGFVSRLPDRVSSLRSFLDAENIDELRRALHQLKGAGSGYGFPQITAAAATAEASIKASADLETVKAQVDELIVLIRGTRGYDQTLEKLRERENDRPEAAHH
jgi:HPt (histidine-containing phosphotransfer) domain-containing protein